MIDNILVPVDGSELSDQAVEFAIETHPESSLTFLHVVETPTGPYGEINSNIKQQILESTTEYTKEIFDSARSLAEDAAFSGAIQTETGVGEPARKIIEHAEDADIIVMGSHRRSLPSRILLGSVAEKVVRRAPVPVTIVR